MNNNRLQQHHSNTTTVQDRRQATATTTADTVHRPITQCRRSDFGVHGGTRPRATGWSDFHGDDADTMAASVALPERFQQTPPTAVTVTPNSAMAVNGDHSGHHRRHYQNSYRPRHTKYNSVSAGSALSQSMRYADGWLYERDAGGTVGHAGVGGRKTRSTFLGREHFDTAAAVAIAAAAAAAKTTVTAVQQPEDPYDRVRKNRMAVPSADKLDRKRNRSGSSRTPSPDYDETGVGGRVVNAASRRRSILECNVNPYDLLRQPSDDDANDDDDDDDTSPKRMSLKDKFMNRIQDTVFTKNKSSLGGFGSFNSSNGPSKKTTTNNGGVNIAGHTVSLCRRLNGPMGNTLLMFHPHQYTV